MESIGELIEKLVIANLKLWMVKDAQTALCCHIPADREALRQVAEQLTRLEWGTTEGGERIGVALRHVMEQLESLTTAGAEHDLERLKDLIRKDIALCETRAALRREISTRLGDRTPADTVKQYGK